MTITSHIAQGISWKSLCATTGLAIAVALPLGVLSASTPAPQVTAQCNDADTEDSFSMSCTPNIIPDTSDQLTEAEVAEPGFNARPGGYGGFGGEGGHAVGGGGHGGGGGGHGR